MEIKFLTKEQSNQVRKEEIFAMSPADRFLAFWKLSKRINSLFPSSISFEERTKGNFVLKRKTELANFGKKILADF